MNDSYACIPPGTPTSLESNRTATTRGSSGCDVGVGERELTVGRADSSRDVAAGYESIERWLLPSLPNLRMLKQCAQYNPPESISDDRDNEGLYDVTSLSMSNQTSNTIACTDSSLQHRQLSAVPLLMDDKNPLSLGSLVDCDEQPKVLASTLEQSHDKNVVRNTSVQVIKKSKDEGPMSPSSLFYIMEQEQRLSSIPTEIIIPSNQMDDDDDDSIPEEPFIELPVGKANFSAHCIRPSPRDFRRQRRQQRSYMQLDVTGFVCEERKEAMTSDISFTDIVCRHVKRSHSLSVTISSVEDECSLPLYIEVKGSSAPRSNFIWRTHYAPDYASV